MAVHDRARVSRLCREPQACRWPALNRDPRSRASTGCVNSSYRSPRFNVSREADSPVVLEICAGIDVAQSRPVGQFGPGELRRITHQKIRQRRAGSRIVRGRAEDRAEDRLPAAELRVEASPPQVAAHFEDVALPCSTSGRPTPGKCFRCSGSDRVGPNCVKDWLPLVRPEGENTMFGNICTGNGYTAIPFWLANASPSARLLHLETAVVPRVAQPRLIDDIRRDDVRVVENRIDRVVDAGRAAAEEAREIPRVDGGLRPARIASEQRVLARELVVHPDIVLIAVERLAGEEEVVARPARRVRRCSASGSPLSVATAPGVQQRGGNLVIRKRRAGDQRRSRPPRAPADRKYAA